MLFISHKNFPGSMQCNCFTNGDTIRGFIWSQMNESASLSLMEYPVNVWKQSETKHNELLHVNGAVCAARNARAAALCDMSLFPCCSYCFAGMHAEGAGGKVQAARPSGGSHAESTEVSPATQGKSAQRVVGIPLYGSVDPWEATGACSCSEKQPRKQCKQHNLYAKSRQGHLPRSCHVGFFSSRNNCFILMQHPWALLVREMASIIPGIVSAWTS